MAEPDLRDKFRELKRLKRLEQRRIKRREEKQRKETTELYPLAGRLFAFFSPIRQEDLAVHEGWNRRSNKISNWPMSI